jgi:hypothetical protein
MPPGSQEVALREGRMNKPHEQLEDSSEVTATPWYVSLFGEEYFQVYGPLLSRKSAPHVRSKAS